MVDRRQRKLEKKRKKRDAIKLRDRRRESHRPEGLERSVASASRAPFGPCAVSPGWDDASAANLVSVTVTRVLGNGLLLPALVLVDRTCLGAKDGPLRPPLTRMELESELDELYIAYGGWEYCEPLIAQSIVFHAIDHAAELGFSPHRDVAFDMFAPRPAVLLDTPLSRSPRPIFIQGPHDDASAIMRRLEERVGPDGFDAINALVETERWLALDDEESLDAEVVEQLSRTV
ncbi:MAG TPA: hypothetical protein VJR89_26980 [Polyangiales bacterium]|nr:hypothetical protein [Polyangiales bacterium]